MNILSKLISGRSGNDSQTDEHGSQYFLPLIRWRNMLQKTQVKKKTEPFPHIVMDDFTRPDILETAVREFPAYETKEWMKTNNSQEIKTSFSKAEELGPVTWMLTSALNSATTLSSLTAFTG